VVKTKNIINAKGVESIIGVEIRVMCYSPVKLAVTEKKFPSTLDDHSNKVKIGRRKSRPNRIGEK
jgi:hypothetical protein